MKLWMLLPAMLLCGCATQYVTTGSHDPSQTSTDPVRYRYAGTPDAAVRQLSAMLFEHGFTVAASPAGAAVLSTAERLLEEDERLQARIALSDEKIQYGRLAFAFEDHGENTRVSMRGFHSYPFMRIVDRQLAQGHPLIMKFDSLMLVLPGMSRW